MKKSTTPIQRAEALIAEQKKQAETKFKMEVQNCMYYPEGELRPRPKTVTKEIYVGMPVTEGIGSDMYPGKITEIRRKGGIIVVNGRNEYTYRAASKDYSKKGYNFGYLMFGVEKSYQSPEF